MNIMLVADSEEDPADRVKILDFGIAKVSSEAASHTKTGIVMGTPAYMSPEQCRSGRNAVDRSDVYALGVIMYEMLAGEPPFRGSAAVLLASHLTQEPTPLAQKVPGVPKELAALVHRMLAKSPADRPAASEVARSLAPASGSLSLQSQPHAAVPAPSDSSTLVRPVPVAAPSVLAGVPLHVRGRLIGVAAAVVLILGLGGGVLVLTMTGRSHGHAEDGGRRDGGSRQAVLQLAPEPPAPPSPPDGGEPSDGGERTTTRPAPGKRGKAGPTGKRPKRSGPRRSTR